MAAQELRDFLRVRERYAEELNPDSARGDIGLFLASDSYRRGDLADAVDRLAASAERSASSLPRIRECSKFASPAVHVVTQGPDGALSVKTVLLTGRAQAFVNRLLTKEEPTQEDHRRLLAVLDVQL